MKKNVIGYNRISEDSIELLNSHFNFTFFKDVDFSENKLFLKKLKEADGVIGMGFPGKGNILDMAPNLKIISNIGTGFDNLDLTEMKKRNVMGTNTPSILNNTTADFIFSLLLASARRIPEMNTFVKEGNWLGTLEKDTFGIDVHNKKLGIIGMGEIGRLIAKRAYYGFDMDILYYNRSRNKNYEKKYKAKYCELNTLLQESDFVCMMTPLTTETKHMINKRHFQLMKKSAIFINGSRGETIVEEDLVSALLNKEIKGAALDVYKNEPINNDNPLLKMNDVITTPHMGASTIETISRMSELAAKNMIKGLNGEEPPNLLTLQAY